MARTDSKRTYATYEDDKMNHLQINIELAKALGWKQGNTPYVPNGHFTAVHGVVECLDADLNVFYKNLDYRDPVVFVAICKHWGLSVHYSDSYYLKPLVQKRAGNSFVEESVEKAAALCVIDLVKQGVR